MAVRFVIKFFSDFNRENPLLGNLAVIGKVKDKKDYVIKLFNANKLPDA
jgi:hypothetical protein